jgi:tetratricopeptide (TPR) repeat protein
MWKLPSRAVVIPVLLPLAAASALIPLAARYRKQLDPDTKHRDASSASVARNQAIGEFIAHRGSAAAALLIEREWCGLFRAYENRYVLPSRAAEESEHAIAALLIERLIAHEFTHAFVSANVQALRATTESEVFARLADISRGRVPFLTLAELMLAINEPGDESHAAKTSRAALAILAALADEQRLTGASSGRQTDADVLARLHTLSGRDLHRLASQAMERRYLHGPDPTLAKLYKDWRSAYGRARDPRVAKALDRMERGRVEKAIKGISQIEHHQQVEVLDEAAARDRSNVQLAHALGLAYGARRWADLSAAELARARSLSQGDLNVVLAYADASLEMDRLDEAHSALVSMQDIDADAPEVLFRIARVRILEHGLQDGEALRILRRCLELRPDHVEARFLAAIVLLGRGEHRDAIAELLQFAEGAPKSATGALLIGASSFEVGSLAAAREYIGRTIELASPYNSVAARSAASYVAGYWGSVGMRVDRISCQKATTGRGVHGSVWFEGLPTPLDVKLSAAHEEEPDVLTHYPLLKGQWYFLRGNFESALEWYERAAALDAGCAHAQLFIGNCFHNLRKFTHARRHFASATELNPRDQVAWYFLGDACVALGDLQSAKSAYERSLAIDPQNERVKSRAKTIDRLLRATSPQRSGTFGTAQQPRQARETPRRAE